MNERIAVIGMGQMGSAMARRQGHGGQDIVALLAMYDQWAGNNDDKIDNQGTK